jgi:hypothetical protein
VPTPTVSELLISAGNRLRVDFESARASRFHAAKTGDEVEEILRAFLNDHLPQRFRVASAFLVDSENSASKQCDIAIYDAINSPILRYNPQQQILPVDHVAAVIEVKSSLSKAELTDAYANIASAKALKKKPLSEMDVAATGSTLRTVGTLGIVFAFDSTTSLDALAANAKELNAQYDAALCPDLICVLDKGSITYLNQFAQPGVPMGMAMMADPNFVVPPAYVLLSILTDGEATLNRLMMMLLSQLTFFVHRPSTLPFAQLLDKANNEAKIVEGYMYDTDRKRHEAPEEHRKPTPPMAQFRIVQNGNDIGQLAYFPWLDGGYVLGRGAPPLPLILGVMCGDPNIHRFMAGDAMYSSILKLTVEQFRGWAEELPLKPPFAGLTLVSTKNDDLPS